MEARPNKISSKIRLLIKTWFVWPSLSFLAVLERPIRRRALDNWMVAVHSIDDHINALRNLEDDPEQRLVPLLTSLPACLCRTFTCGSSNAAIVSLFMTSLPLDTGSGRRRKSGYAWKKWFTEAAALWLKPFTTIGEGERMTTTTGSSWKIYFMLYW